MTKFVCDLEGNFYYRDRPGDEFQPERPEHTAWREHCKRMGKTEFFSLLRFAKWITIGGKEKGEEKHHGGFRVLIADDGTILKGGPRMLHGKNVKAVKGLFDAQKEKSRENQKIPSTGVDNGEGSRVESPVSGEQPKPQEKKMERIALKGTEKQIQFAEDIRRPLLDEIEAILAAERLREEPQPGKISMLETALQSLSLVADPKFWIENARGMKPLALATDAARWSKPYVRTSNSSWDKPTIAHLRVQIALASKGKGANQ